MTYEEAKLERIRMLKIDIRNRLHRIDPDKYPKVKGYSALDAFIVAHTLTFQDPNYKNPFDRDDIFYREMIKRIK